MLRSITRSERVIIVDDDRIRSVVIGPRQRLRPAFFIGLASAGMLFACLGWALTAAELIQARQTATFIEEGSRALAAQLAESRNQVAALGGELEGAQVALSAALAEDAETRSRIAAALNVLDVPEMRDNAKAVQMLRTALTTARDGLNELASVEAGHLAAAARSLENVENARHALAVRRAQAAIAAVEMAAARADAPLTAEPALVAEGLAMALAEAQAESARLREEAATALTIRDQALATAAETESRMVALTDGQVELLSHLTVQTDMGIDQMEGALRQTGLDLDRILAQFDDSAFGRGGPLTLASIQADMLPRATTEAMSALEDRMDRQARLRALMHLLPLSAPANDFYVTSGFGRRLDPFTNQRALHGGIDLVAKFRSPVMATAPGKVVNTAYEAGGYGRMVEVDHGFGIRTRYAHLDKITVKKGDTVVHGQQLGLLGNTGRSTGAHLHYEVLVDGRPVFVSWREGGMFAKVKERLDSGAKGSPRPTGGTPSGARPMPSIVGPDMTVSGNLSTPGEIHVEGRVNGDVTCAKLIIGAGGLINGKVQAGSVRVHGKVDGAIDAEEVYLLAGSEVLGDIYQGTLEIAPGAAFEGAVRRRASTLPVPALQPPAPAPTVIEQEGHFEPVEEEAAAAAPASGPTAGADAEKPAAPEAAAPDATAESAPAKAEAAKPETDAVKPADKPAETKPKAA